MIQDGIYDTVGNSGRCGFNYNVATVITAIAVHLACIIGINDNSNCTLIRRTVHLHIANNMCSGDNTGSSFVTSLRQVRLHFVSSRTAISINSKVGL